MYLQLKFNVCNNNKQISQFDSQLTNLKKKFSLKEIPLFGSA